ncbi:hypothetical protein JYU14_01155 [Simkania negevensis]|uniref:HEPN domain-containing protein n=1 Tax=Simkania negevensis TaxID=83561 RepID=A0ABS3AQR7_9BACT|nr:hypothetical protein [Simkania negevensis]
MMMLHAAVEEIATHFKERLEEQGVDYFEAHSLHLLFHEALCEVLELTSWDPKSREQDLVLLQEKFEDKLKKLLVYRPQYVPIDTIEAAVEVLERFLPDLSDEVEMLRNVFFTHPAAVHEPLPGERAYGKEM